ncbi:MAG: homocysteine S-methyltransferase family protein [Candidatus Omnitrophota bacterium]
MNFRKKLEKDVILLDGAFGTYVQSLDLTEADFHGKTGCMEYLTFSRPDLIGKIHSDYLEAGADAVETNTFGGNAIKLAEYGLEDKVYEINKAATDLARSAADRFSKVFHPKYVIGTMGPTGKLPSSSDPVLGNIGYGDLKKVFYDQALGVIDGGADALLIETGQDLLEMKAAVNGAKQAIEERGRDLVLMAQCTLANNGRMLLGTEISAMMTTLSYLGVDVIGMNCSTGPAEMEQAVKYLSENSPTFISCVPNAGLPVESQGKTHYTLGPEEMAGIMGGFLRDYRMDVVGGCCGTNPEHIRKMRESLTGARKRKRAGKRYFSSFYKGYDLGKMVRPIKVGERINTQGSRRMKDLLMKENFDEIVEMGKQQQAAGAELLDVCAVLSERSTEKRDMVTLTVRLGESVQVPLMIDSTDAGVIEAALQKYPGTAFINSVNLEDGGEKARRVFALAKEHGSFVVCLAIDEKGMAKTVKHKVEVAERLYRMATAEYGLEGHRLVFDLLTFTLGTGEKEYADSGVNTCKAITELKKRFPEVLTVLGASNISFGLAKEGRKILNAVFLHHAACAGLDMAIVNPAESVKYDGIPDNEKALAEDLLLGRNTAALERFVDHFAKKGPVKKEKPEKEISMTVEGKIQKCVMDRNKAGIIPLVDEALKTRKPEDIINNILMEAMKKVGEKLDSGEMVLPYVLQSAEVMRKALEHLNRIIPAHKAYKGGKVLLATVFGDVHDIGKNLVKMILQNNGFEVIDLGKQVPVEKIIEEAKKNDVDAVGLSALLVSTARHMKTCVQEMHEAGLSYPVIIGGSPVSEKFAKEVAHLKDDSVYRGGVFYARDAFMGLKVVQALIEPKTREKAIEEYLRKFGEKPQGAKEVERKRVPAPVKKLERKEKVPAPPFYGARAISNIPADEIFGYLNERALFDHSWAAGKAREEKERLINEEFRPLLKELKEETLRKNWLDFKAAYGYFKCRAENEILEVLDEKGKVLEEIRFERVREGAGGSLADYFISGPEGYDIVAFQAVTVGGEIGEAITSLIDKKEYSKGFFLHGFSVHLAEALASYTHDRIRKELSIKGDQGRRYSPGYPLWKNMEDQRKIFKLLECEKRLGLTLTEGFQIVPEQSTTAMIVYNDLAEY